MFYLAPLLVAAVTPTSDATVRISLSVNGLALSERPFLDHTHTWPPSITWKIEEMDISNTTEYNLRQASYDLHINGVYAGGQAGADMRHDIGTSPVQSNSAHDVNISVTLTDGRIVKASGQFRTALLDGFGDAAWISGGTLLKRELSDLSISRPPPSPSAAAVTVVNATAFASGVGCFAMRIDGALVSSSFMDPGWATLPTKRVTYRAFDLTSLFAAAATPPKQLRVALGMCKYSYQDAFCVGGHAANGACKAFLMSLQVAYSDGSNRTIVTSASDGKWEATTDANPIRYSHLYHGEQYDGTVVDDATKWQPATPSMFDTGLGAKGGSSMVPASKALGAPALLTMPPLEVSKSYTPLSVNKVGLSSKSATAAAPPLTFIRCLGADSYCGQSIFFVDAKNQTRHHVTACNQCGVSPCANAKTVAPADVAALQNGTEFDCSMVPGGGGGGTKWVFDMGDNLAGFATLQLPRSAFVANQPVSLKYAEVLEADGSVQMAWCNGQGPACHCSGINCANQTDTFIPPLPTASTTNNNGSGAAELVTYTPSFTYHGFRYVQLEGIAATYTPTVADMTGLFVHSAVAKTGNVTFSNRVLDGVQKAIVQTQLSNLHFHPTDCPTREKRGWTGDAQFTSRQASLNLDMRQLYGNWLQTMQDHDLAGCAINGAAPAFPQTNKDICCNPKHGSFGCDYTSIPNGTFSNPGGSVADVVPFMHVGGWPGDPSWGSISSVLPYTVWKGGDDGLVADYYNGAKRNVDFFIREAGADGLIEFGYYGDWLQLEKTDKPQVTSTAQIMSTSHLVEMAVHLGKTADAAAYNASLAKMKLAYHAKYWNAEEQSYHGVTPCQKPSCPAGNTGSQTANLMPLILDIPPPKERAMAAAALVASVQAKGNATSSGLVGASFILQALVQAGRGDIALSMAMREEEPSWGYMVKQGPGTIWETWTDTSNSHNHPMFTASIGPYLYSIAGLDPTTWSIPSFLRKRRLRQQQRQRRQQQHGEGDAAAVVTMHVTPDPNAVRVLGQATGTVNTMCGQVSVEWHMHKTVPGQDQHFEMIANIPHNCGQARLALHVPVFDTATSATLSDGGLCIGEYRVVAPAIEEEEGGAQGPLPLNVARVELALDGKTVDVFVGGGRAQLKLGRC